MKAAFGIVATSLVATQTNALEWSDVKEFAGRFDASHFAKAMLEIDIYDYTTWNQYMGTNGHHVRAELA